MGKITRLVIPIIPKAEDRVWECTCGCQLFYIIDTEYVQCSECDAAHSVECKLIAKPESSDDG